jgi:hypothetical protein
LSIFFMIRSAHCTAAATKDSVLGLGQPLSLRGIHPPPNWRS